MMLNSRLRALPAAGRRAVEQSNAAKTEQADVKDKVILIHPRIFERQYESLPLAPLMLAATLEESGFRPVVVDQATDEDYRETISKHIDEAIYVGISAISGDQIRFGLEICDYVREISPSTPVVWGGRHASALPEQTARDRRVDIVVHGEGDLTAVELAKAIQEGRALEEVKGITFKKNSGMVTTPHSESIRDLNMLPGIPWHLFDFNKYYSGRRKRRLAVQTGRGCPYSCTFCSHKTDAEETFREFNPEHILDNIEQVIKEHGIDTVDLYEPFFVSDSARVKEFCRGLIERNIDVDWTASARANNFWKLPADVLQLMRKSGCRYLTFGFESGSRRTLKRISKRIEVEDILSSVKVCREYNIIPEACFIVGFPFETPEDTLATMKVIAQVRKICSSVVFHVQMYTAFPGSILHNECLDHFGLKSPGSLAEWGDYAAWRNHRPWLSKRQKYFLRLLNGSIYASSLEYLLRERPEIRFARPVHHMVCSAYSIYLNLFGGIIKKV